MSIINATLVAQAFHFFIAYLLIKHLFFKPVFAQIEQEEKLQESLITTVQSHQHTVALKEQELTAQWQALKKYVAAHMPVIKPIDISFRTKTHIELPHIAPEQLNKSISEASQEIIKKVKNVW